MDPVHVVAEVTYLRVLESRFSQDFLVRRKLFERVLLNVVQAEFAGAIFNHWGTASRDQAGLKAGLTRQANAQPVAGVEGLGFQERLRGAATRMGHVVDAPVRHDPVDIHQQEFDLPGAPAKFSGGRYQGVSLVSSPFSP